MSHRITDWDPEDVVAWEAGNKNIARRNLIWSVAAEHIGFSVWSIWSVMVLCMPESVYGFSAGDKFLLGATATLAGACLRIPYTLATATFGGRNWTVFSAFVLPIPTVATMWPLAHPGLPLWPYIACAALTGFGGGNFASSMTSPASPNAPSPANSLENTPATTTTDTNRHPTSDSPACKVNGVAGGLSIGDSPGACAGTCLLNVGSRRCMR
jgi:hypothetical protein